MVTCVGVVGAQEAAPGEVAQPASEETATEVSTATATVVVEAPLVEMPAAPAVDPAVSMDAVTEAAPDPALPADGVPPADRSEPAPDTAAETAAETAIPSYSSTVLGRKSRQARLTGSAQVVSAEVLQQFEHDDVQKVLKQVPGVYVREEDGFGLRPNIGLRGVNSDRSAKVTLMEDGVLFGPAPYSAPAAYYFPATTRMESLEVFKGPGSIRAGPATIGGAINLISRRIPAGFGAGLDAGYGAFGGIKLHGHAGWGGERFGLLLEGLRLQSDGFRQLDGGGNTGFEKHEAVLKAQWTPPAWEGARQKLELKLGWADEDSRETYLGLTDADFRITPWRRYAASALDRMVWSRTAAQLAWNLVVGEQFDLRVTAYRHDMGRVWNRLNRFRDGRDIAEVLRTPSGVNGVYAAVLAGRADSEGLDQQLMLARNDRAFVSQGLQASGWWAFGLGASHHELLFGARLHGDEIRRLHVESPYDMVGGRLTAGGGGTETTADNTGSARAVALHLLDEVDLGPWTITSGLRLEGVEMSLDDRLSGLRTAQSSWTPLPALGVAYQPLRELTLLAGVHRGYAPVTAGQPAEVRPEESVNVEAGGRWQERRQRAELIGFHNAYSNLVGECTGSSGCLDQQLNRQFNGGQVDVWGVEASAGGERRWGDWRLGLDGSYTLTQSRFRSSFVSDFPQFGAVTAGDALPYVPEHQAAATVTGRYDWLSVALSGTLVGPMRDRAGQGAVAPADATDPQLLLDAVVTAQLPGAGAVYLKGTNLADAAFVASRRPFGARASQPRMVFLGYKRDFGEKTE